MGINSQSRNSFEFTDKHKTPTTMKFALVAAATGAGIASASLASLNKNIAAQFKNGTESRAFVGEPERGLEAINGYGCWCYLDNEWRDADQKLINRPSILAHGQVVDTIDEACRALINAYKCIEMDAEANGDFDCDAQSVPYDAYNSFQSTVSLEVYCNRENVGLCAINACIAEGAFTFMYRDYFIGNPIIGDITSVEGYNVAHTHASNNGGTFDPAVECQGIPNPVGSDKECCGDFALQSRKPFRLYSGFTTRSCCSNQVLNNELNKCCAIGTDAENVVDINDNC